MSQQSGTQGYTIKPIGLIHSPYTNINLTPIQPPRSNAPGWVEVFPEFAEGLHSLEGFSHIILLYISHKSDGDKLQVKPFLDDKLHGVFSTRYPFRPNPIGFSIVRLLTCHQNLLEIGGVDVL